MAHLHVEKVGEQLTVTITGLTDTLSLEDFSEKFPPDEDLERLLLEESTVRELEGSRGRNGHKEV